MIQSQTNQNETEQRRLWTYGQLDDAVVDGGVGVFDFATNQDDALTGRQCWKANKQKDETKHGRHFDFAFSSRCCSPAWRWRLALAAQVRSVASPFYAPTDERKQTVNTCRIFCCFISLTPDSRFLWPTEPRSWEENATQKCVFFHFQNFRWKSWIDLKKSFSHLTTKWLWNSIDFLKMFSKPQHDSKCVQKNDNYLSKCGPHYKRWFPLHNDPISNCLKLRIDTGLSHLIERVKSKVIQAL